MSTEKTDGHVAERVTSAHGHNLADDTNTAINNEHNMSVRESIRFWWKAIVFSFVISLCVVMEGYDTSLMNKFFAFTPFRNRFGDQVDAEGEKLVSARWQTIILNGTQVGCILGLIINGYVTEWIGYKKTMIGSMLFMIGAVFIPFFSTGLEMFLVGGIIQGLPWGVPNTRDFICSRSLPDPLARIYDFLDQHVLGHRWPSFNWYSHWSHEERNTVGLPCTICPAVDLAHSDHPSHSPGARITMVARTTRSC